MRGATLISTTAHLVLAAILYVGLPDWLSNDDPTLDEQVFVVELVQVDDETVAAREAPKSEPNRPPDPPAPGRPPPREPNPGEEPVPEADALEPAPPVAAPSSAPEPDAPLATPRPRTKPEAPLVVQAPRPRSKPEPPRVTPEFDAPRLAALLDRSREDAAPAEARDQEEAAARDREPVVSPNAVPDRPLTLSEIDAFRAKVESCWSIPVGARDSQDLKVTLRIFLAPDGTLARAHVVANRERMNRPGQEFFRTAAESALRAVLRCAPYRMLPPEKYDSWQDIELTFDPRDIG